MTTTAFLSPTLVTFGGDKFRSDRRYLRAGSSGSTFAIAKSRTLDIVDDGNGFSAWRYSVNGFVKSYSLPSGLSATNDATYTLVKV